MLDAAGLPRGSAVWCNIVAKYNTEIPLHISPDEAQLGARNYKAWNPKVAGSSPLCATIFLPITIACWYTCIHLYK